MSTQFYGPFDVRPGVLQRSTNLIDLIVRHRPGTTDLRLYASSTLADAYGTLVDSGIAGSGGTAILEAPVTKVGAIAQSPSVAARGWTLPETRRGHTSYQLNMEDYGSPDDRFAFFRLQEKRGGAWLAVAGAANTNKPIMGPILVVPNPSAYGSAASVLSLQTDAPAGTGCTAGDFPVVDATVQTPLPMHIVLPRPAATLTITNQSGTDDLLVSFGLGMPMFAIAPGTQSIPTGGGYSLTGVREIVLASSTVTALPFSIEAVISNEKG